MEGLNTAKKEPEESPEEKESIEKLREKILAKRSFILGMCRKILGRDDMKEAEEFANQALFKAFEKAWQYRGGNLDGWLRKITWSIINASFRDPYKKAPKLSISGEEEDIELTDSKLDPEKSAIKNEERAILKKAMERLGGDEKEALELRLKGEEYEDVAKIMNKSVPAVKSIVHRAKTKLLEYFKKSGGDVKI